MEPSLFKFFYKAPTWLVIENPHLSYRNVKVSVRLFVCHTLILVLRFIVSAKIQARCSRRKISYDYISVLRPDLFGFCKSKKTVFLDDIFSCKFGTEYLRYRRTNRLHDCRMCWGYRSQTVSMCAMPGSVDEPVHATIVHERPVGRQLDNRWARLRRTKTTTTTSVTDRYRSSLLSPVVGRVLDDPQLSLSSLSCVRLGALHASVSSRHDSMSWSRGGGAPGAGSWRRLERTLSSVGCLRGRRRRSARSHGVTWPRHAAFCHLPASTVTTAERL